MIWLLSLPLAYVILGMVVAFFGRNQRQYPYEDDL